MAPTLTSLDKINNMSNDDVTLTYLMCSTTYFWFCRLFIQQSKQHSTHWEIPEFPNDVQQAVSSRATMLDTTKKRMPHNA